MNFSPAQIDHFEKGCGTAKMSAYFQVANKNQMTNETQFIMYGARIKRNWLAAGV